MEFFYYVMFGGLAAVVAALELSKTNKDRTNTSAAFNSFKNNYLVVYSLMMGIFSISSVRSASFYVPALRSRTLCVFMWFLCVIGGVGRSIYHFWIF